MALEQIAADIEKLDYIQQPVIERAVSSEYNLKIQEIDDILTNGLAAVKPQNTVQLNAQKLDSPLYDGDSVEAKIKNQIGKNIIKEKTLEHSLNYLTDQDLKSFTEDSVVRQKVEDLINTYGLDHALLESKIKVDTINTEIDGYYNQRSAITLGETISPDRETISPEDIAEAKIRIQIAKNLTKVETLEHSLGYLTDQELKSSTEDSVVRQKVEDSINKYGLDSALLKSQTKVDTLNTEIDDYYSQRSAITLGETISPDTVEANIKSQIGKNLIKEKTLEHSLGYLTDQDLKNFTEDSVVRQKVEDLINKYGLDSALLKSQTKVDTLETEIDAHYDQRSAITLGETISPEEQLINKVIETHKTLGYFDFSDDKSAEMSVEEAREYIEKVKSIYGSDLAESYIDTRHRYSANPDDSYTQIDLIDIKEKMNSHIKASESYTLNEKRTSPTYKI